MSQSQEGVADILRAGEIGLHAATVPQSVRGPQQASCDVPHTGSVYTYRFVMPPVDPRTYLWANICRLMRDPSPSLDKAQRACHVGRGTVQRIKDGDASTRLSTLYEVSQAFGLEVWQLLVPRLDADGLPRLQEANRLTPGALQVAELFDGLDDGARDVVLKMCEALTRPPLPATLPGPGEESLSSPTAAHFRGQ